MRSMHKLYTGVLLITTLLVSSCAKEIELSPTSIITNSSFWKTEADAEGALTGMYVKLRSLALLNLFVWGEARSEVMEWGAVSGTLDYDRYYLNTLNATGAGPTWQGIYSGVNAANLIIKYVPTISFASDAAKNKILAQAHTMRAYLYFVMARTWGEVPIWTEPVEGYSAETTQNGKAPVAEVFKLIKDDLDKAIQLYPDNSFPAGRNRWSKAGANALKADVYLWTGKKLNGGANDFNTALAATNEVAGADVTLLPNFADLYKYSNKGNKEVVMSVGFKELEGAGNNYFYNMYSAFLPTDVDPQTGELVGQTAGGMVWTVTKLVRDQFSVEDSRRDASFREIPNYPSLILKGRGTVIGGVRQFTSDVLIYRYADVLLMKAEAKNALGQDPSAEINQLRQRAYGANYPNHIFVNGTQQQNDDAILKERLLELVFEGKRWWDLVRFNKAFELVPSLQSRAGQNHLLVWPIAQSVLSLEPNVTQNPGY